MDEVSYVCFDRVNAGRRLLLGGAAGVLLVASLLVAGASPGLAGTGLAVGAIYALAFSPERGTPLDHAFAGAAVGVLAWLLVTVTLYPALGSFEPGWTATGMLAALPELVGWSVGAAGAGAIAAVLCTRFVEPSGPETPGVADEEPVETRIVIVGGGFAGVAAAKRLEARFGPDPTVELILVSDTNALLFTPMLAEVAAGTLEPTQIMTPYRTSLRRTRVITAEAEDADLAERRLYFAEGDPVEFDHLILATGATTNYFGMDDIRSFAFPFKTLDDAVGLRNHVIQCFARAERTDDPARRKELLTFVVAGAGFAGTELAGALNDFAHELLAYHPYLSPDLVTVELVHSGDRVMPALAESLSAYALERLEERGVEVRLGTRVAGTDPETGGVSLDSGGPIETETLVWTAGVRPDPFIENLDLPTSDGGGVQADATFAVSAREGVWAAGDCAAVADPETGERHPPTAQYATRAGKHLADNVFATVKGEATTPFTYRSAGKLAVIGHNSACAEIAGRQFSGLFAWLLWRAIYLNKLPGADRRIRVSLNWAVELLFPRDIVLTGTTDREAPGG